ncbi:hypothetical protein C8Q80DRAFT_1358975 [Daedaleopsis nitida]|nr:hypothetical protein C8Q80DRAFT_1358975 [Daedaleopsis nitida]
MSSYDYDLWYEYFQDPEAVKYYVTVNYVQFASASLLFYDFFLTFGDEVQIFYRRRRKLPTLLIVLIRYNAFLSAAATLLADVRFTKDSGPYLTEATQNTYIPVAAAAFSVAFELLCWLLTVMKTWKNHRVHLKNGVQTRLSTLLLRDGSFYFVMLVVLAAFEIVGSFELALPKGIGASFSQSLIPIFTTRFIARLRQTVEGDGSLRTVEVSDVNFQRDPAFSHTRVAAAFGGEIHMVYEEGEPADGEADTSEQNASDSNRGDSEEYEAEAGSSRGKEEC